MNDIDFDELDRAVSSVITPNASNDTPAPQPAAPSVPAESTPAPATTPAPSPAARRSSGRFMDVVHPSSDMRTGTGSTQSRPLDVPSRPTATPTPAPAAPRSTESSSFQWPDPLDMMGDTSTPEEKQPEAPEEPTSDESQTPMDSPFLSDAKVEKRPLGSPTPVKSLEESLAELTAETSAAADEASASAPSSPPPAAAGAVDVSALEVSEETLIGASTSSDTTPGATPIPDDVEDPIPAFKGAEVTAEAPVVTGPTSITQQYKEHTSTTEQPSGAIYDTESYHQPLAHPQKKQSSLAVIFWILGLIVLGAGLGAAMYFFVLPLL